MSSSNRSKQLCSFYFTSVIPNDHAKNGKWVCNKCGKTKLKSGGWTNLLNHVWSCGVDSFAVEFDSIKPDKACITSFVLRVSNAEHDMFKRIEWLVMKNLPLSIVDCPLTRSAVRFKPVMSKLLQNTSFPCAALWRTMLKKDSQQVCHHFWWLDRRYSALHWGVCFILFVINASWWRSGLSNIAVNASTSNWRS